VQRNLRFATNAEFGHCRKAENSVQKAEANLNLNANPKPENINKTLMFG